MEYANGTAGVANNGVQYVLPLGLAESLGFVKGTDADAKYATKESLKDYALKSEIGSGGGNINLSEYLKVSDFNEKLDSALYTIDITSKLDFNVISNRITLPPIPSREQIEQMVSTAVGNIQVPQPDLTNYFTKDQTAAKVEEILTGKEYVTETKLNQVLSTLPQGGGIDKGEFTNELKATFVEKTVYTPAIEGINTALEEKATKAFVNEEITKRITSLNGGSINLDGYATETFVTTKLNDYTKTAELNPVIEGIVNPKLANLVTNDNLTNAIVDVVNPKLNDYTRTDALEGVVTGIVDPKLGEYTKTAELDGVIEPKVTAKVTEVVDGKNFATQEFVTTKIGEIPPVDLDPYLKTETADEKFLTKTSAEETYAKKSDIQGGGANLDNYYTKEETNNTFAKKGEIDISSLDTMNISGLRKLFAGMNVVLPVFDYEIKKDTSHDAGKYKIVFNLTQGGANGAVIGNLKLVTDKGVLYLKKYLKKPSLQSVIPYEILLGNEATLTTADEIRNANDLDPNYVAQENEFKGKISVTSEYNSDSYFAVNPLTKFVDTDDTYYYMSNVTNCTYTLEVDLKDTKLHYVTFSLGNAVDHGVYSKEAVCEIYQGIYKLSSKTVKNTTSRDSGIFQYMNGQPMTKAQFEDPKFTEFTRFSGDKITFKFEMEKLSTSTYGALRDIRVYNKDGEKLYLAKTVRSSDKNYYQMILDTEVPSGFEDKDADRCPRFQGFDTVTGKQVLADIKTISTYDNSTYYLGHNPFTKYSEDNDGLTSIFMPSGDAGVLELTLYTKDLPSKITFLNGGNGYGCKNVTLTVFNSKGQQVHQEAKVLTTVGESAEIVTSGINLG